MHVCSIRDESVRSDETILMLSPLNPINHAQGAPPHPVSSRAACSQGRAQAPGRGSAGRPSTRPPLALPPCSASSTRRHTTPQREPPSIVRASRSNPPAAATASRSGGGMWGVCDVACAAVTYGAAFVLLPLLLGLPQVKHKQQGEGCREGGSIHSIHAMLLLSVDPNKTRLHPTHPITTTTTPQIINQGMARHRQRFQDALHRPGVRSPARGVLRVSRYVLFLFNFVYTGMPRTHTRTRPPQTKKTQPQPQSLSPQTHSHQSHHRHMGPLVLPPRPRPVAARAALGLPLRAPAGDEPRALRDLGRHPPRRQNLRCGFDRGL